MHAFDVLGDPVRRRILELLAIDARPSGAVVEVIGPEFGISQSAVSQHLAVLRESGFTTVRADGNRRIYSLDVAPLREIDEWIERFRHLWGQRLDALHTGIARGNRPTTEGHTLMIDILSELAAIHRSVAQEVHGPDDIVAVTMRRTYVTDPADLWDALTSPERIAHWFLPITGDLRVSGNFQLEGNAGGQILVCEPPRFLRTTFGGESSIVSLTLDEIGSGDTELVLEHTVPVAMAGSVAGALYVGPGWDGAFFALALHLTGRAPADPVAASSSPERMAFSRESVALWSAVALAAGAAAEDVDVATRAALAQFSPDPV